MSDAAPRAGKRRAVFLDRDGTINVEKNYLFRIEDWEWIEGAQAAILRINERGWLAIVVTNQAGIARGLYRHDDVAKLHARVDAMLAQTGARIDGYYVCPHHPEFDEACACRKPLPGLLLRAAGAFDIDLRGSFLIGDKMSDMQAARAAGVTPILVATGYGAEEGERAPEGILRAADLPAAVDWILRAAG